MTIEYEIDRQGHWEFRCLAGGLRSAVPRATCCTAFVFLIGILAPDGPCAAEIEESDAAHGIVAEVAITLTPQPLRAFLETHQAALRREATGAGVSEDRKTSALEAARHFVTLDAGTRSESYEARKDAARAFPRSLDDARTLYEKHEGSPGGTLPWNLEEECQILTRMFAGGKTQEIVRAAGRVAHFAADAALPFHSTWEREKPREENLWWEKDDESPASMGHRLPYLRIEHVLLERHKERMLYEVRVQPDRAGPLREARDAIFATLMRSFETANGLAEIDAVIAEEIKVDDADSFLASQGRYYTLLSERALPLVEDRLEAGAILAAGLIAGAWEKAGRPSLPAVTPVALPPDVPAPSANPPGETKPPVDAAGAAFVGSRSSTIFHRTTCGHSIRIKPDNRVTFTTAEQAKAAGRTPCRTCLPDG